MNFFEQSPLIILAGGQSRRMGRDKGELLIDGQRLIERLIERAAPQCGQIVISGPRAYGLPFRYIEDIQAGPQGPAAGIYAASQDREMRESGAIGFFTVPVDGPNLPPDFTQRLWSERHSAIAKDAERRHPAFGWWRFSDIETALQGLDVSQSLSLNALADMCRARSVSWDNERAFINLNTPKDAAMFKP